MPITISHYVAFYFLLCKILWRFKYAHHAACRKYFVVPDIIVSLQAQPISAELAAKLLGNRVAVSPIVTVEPRRRKFHKPITLTIPVPQAANKGMINQYSGDAPTLRLLCSITGKSSNADGYSNCIFLCSVYQTC